MTKDEMPQWRTQGYEAAESPNAGRVLAYFAPERDHPGVRRRVRMIEMAGFECLVFSFRRRRFIQNFEVDWANVDLGEIRSRSYLRRLGAWLKALGTILRCRREIERCDVFYARNLDMTLIAIIASLLVRSRPRIVYEVLDVQPACMGSGVLGRLLRWMERRVLAQSDLLIVSSPGFIESYFKPIQAFDGPWCLIENKLLPLSGLPPRPSAMTTAPVHRGMRAPVWTIGWFGALRCQESLDILTHTARALPDHVRIYLRGFPDQIREEGFLDAIASLENFVYGGPYSNLNDLSELFGAIDLNWCLDLSDERNNSRWLLPNRIYEGGYFGVPALAIAGHQTGRFVRDHGLGWTIDEPLERNLVRFIEELDTEKYEARRATVVAAPSSMFVDTGDFAAAMDALDRSA